MASSAVFIMRAPFQVHASGTLTKRKATLQQDGFFLSGILLFSHSLTAHRLEILLPARHRWVSRPWLAGPALLAGPFLML
jgi:hypothetical protein